MSNEAPTLADFAPRLVLPSSVPITDVLGEALVEIVQMARQDRYDPQPEIAFIEYKVAAVVVLCCGVGLNCAEANQIAQDVWDAVQQEHHA